MLGLSGVKLTYNVIRMGVEGGENRDLGGKERVTRSMVTLGTWYGVVGWKQGKRERWKLVNSQ